MKTATPSRWFGAVLVLPLAFSLLNPFADLLPSREHRDDQASKAYYGPYLLTLSADRKRDTGQSQEALTLYRDALKQFREMAHAHPKWNPDLVTYRIGYCEQEIAKLTGAPPPVPPGSAAPGRRTEPMHRRSPAEAAKEAAGALRAGRGAEALPGLLEALADFPGDPELTLLAAMCHCANRAFAKAAAMLAPLVEREPGNTRARVALAAAVAGRGDLAEARVQLEMALAVDPNLAEAHYDLAQLLLLRSPPDAAAAQAHYQAALQLGAAPDADLADLIRLMREMPQSGPDTSGKAGPAPPGEAKGRP